ncbi:MAG: ATP phosphoribosyltransferase [Eubacteriaceae bacterium]|nr:ATP phosphoribosyltransferase [Eubacteriaceae bacterium]
MNYERANLRPEEKATLELRGLYEENGYKKYKMSKFEEYGLYANNRDFLAGDKVLTFTDLDGRLMALKPDVTLSIIKNTAIGDSDLEKFYYVENVYRESRESNSFKEIEQIGLEMIGKIGDDEIAETVNMAAETLKTVNKDFVLELSHMDFTEELLRTIDLNDEVYKHIIRLIRAKNPDGIRKVSAAEGLPQAAIESLCAITELSGPVAPTLEKARKLAINKTMLSALDEIESIYSRMENSNAKNLMVDFSMVNDIDYYNGVIFKGYFRDVAGGVLAGGQYDRAMTLFGRRAGAIGFALYLNEVAKLGEKTAAEKDDMLTIALPKGRLGDQVYDILSNGGYECEAYNDKNRKLVIENVEKNVRYILVKPSDVAVYVEHRAADVGIVGKDILLENDPDVYELKDLDIGKCRMSVAAPKGYIDDPDKTLRVATKYVNVAKKHYQEQNRDIEIIKLNGSIELGPILGLSDVIVDIVETGSTIRENDLEVVEEFKQISARFIANKTSYKFKNAAINEMVEKL